MCERGWVLWLRGERPAVGRWTGPVDWASPYRDGGPGELDDVMRLAAPVAGYLGITLWPIRVHGERTERRTWWRVSHVRDQPIRATAGPHAPIPDWLLAELADRPHVRRRMLRAADASATMLASGRWRGWWAAE